MTEAGAPLLPDSVSSKGQVSVSEPWVGSPLAHAALRQRVGTPELVSQRWPKNGAVTPPRPM